jgi:predicted amidohydrolase YtcJ
MNAAGMRWAGVTRAPLHDPIMEKGVVRDAYGNPTGSMLEAAMGVEHALVERVPREKRLAILKAAATYLNSFGITGVVNATGDLEEVELYGELRDRGQLTVRTRTAFGSIAQPHRLTTRFLSDLETARRRYSDAWASANLVKFFADGDTGSYPPLVYNADNSAATSVCLARYFWYERSEKCHVRMPKRRPAQSQMGKFSARMNSHRPGIVPLGYRPSHRT